jgi:deoxyhypusine monooxygenase|tara:strand:+ start:57 stop:1202 length:1146 start_codon:yes stop_codon:yes gene_type:complete
MTTLVKEHFNVVMDDKAAKFLHSPGIPSMDSLKTCLLTDVTSPAAKTTRAIYYLRSIGTDLAVDILCQALLLKSHTPLIRHEIGYVLGQMQQIRACQTLEDVLKDDQDNVMVRHECAEALGAIGEVRSLPLLEKMAALPNDTTTTTSTTAIDNDTQSDTQNDTQNDTKDNDFTCSPKSNTATKVRIPEELRETCEIARDFCKWKAEGEQGQRPQVACACMLSPYNSYDPAPPSPETDNLSTLQLGNRLRNTTNNLALFERYQAMFALRDRGGEECVIELGRTLVEDESSALLRHEVAYVLGQMAHPAAILFLAESLRRRDEHNMVRHEAAEALGAIEGDEKDAELCLELLKEFSNPMTESDGVVRESCEVALDTLDYWSNF